MTKFNEYLIKNKLSMYYLSKSKKVPYSAIYRASERNKLSKKYLKPLAKEMGISMKKLSSMVDVYDRSTNKKQKITLKSKALVYNNPMENIFNELKSIKKILSKLVNES